MSVPSSAAAAPAAAVPAPKPVFQYDVAKTFGIDTGGKPFLIAGEDPNASNSFVPTRDPLYLFEKSLMRVLSGWWRAPARNEGLLAFGPTGAGKTTLFKQFFARLNVPVVTIPCGKNTKLEDYLFQPVFENSGGFSMRYEPGPLALAVMNGWPVLLDEVDRLPAKEATRLHEWMDGSPLVVPQLSKDPLPRSKKLRFLATANTQLRGDESGVHPGAQKQDGAFLQRFIYLRVGYLDTEAEVELVKAKYPNMPEPSIRLLVDLANCTRSAYVDGGKDGSAQLGVVLSTRKVLEVAHYAVMLRDDKNPFLPALEVCLLASATAPEREAILNMLKLCSSKQQSSNP